MAPDSDRGVQVIISVRNGENFLLNCLLSVDRALQNHKWILILGDDDSTDETFVLARKLSQTLSAERVIIKRFRKADNVSIAKNRLVLISKRYSDTHPWICFADDDDLMGEDRIDKLLPIAIETGARIVVGGWHLVDEDKSVQTISADCSRDTLRFGPWATLIHQSLIPEDGKIFSEEVNVYEDMLLWKTLKIDGQEFVAVNDSIVAVHFRRKGTASSFDSEDERRVAWKLILDKEKSYSRISVNTCNERI